MFSKHCNAVVSVRRLAMRRCIVSSNCQLGCGVVVDSLAAAQYGHLLGFDITIDWIIVV